MLNHDQARRMAEQILADQRRVTGDHHWWAARVPIMLRCEALQALEPYERVQVVDAVRRSITAQQSLLYLTAMLGVAMGGALLLLALGGPQFDWALAAYLGAVLLPSLAYARWVLKPRVRAAATALAKTRTSKR